MRLEAAIRGQLKESMRAELDAATAGVQRAVRRAQQELKEELRGDLRSAGLGGLEKTWQDKGRRGLLFYPNKGLDAAAIVRNNAAHAIEAHTAGAVIVPRRGRYLAIPTPEALRLRRGKRKMTPRTFPGGMKRLRYVPRPNGPDLLVLDTGGQTKTGRYRRGSRTVVMFILVKSTRLRRRLRPYQRVADQVADRLPEMIQREYAAEAGGP